MTPTIQLCMLVIAAIILLVCKVKVNDVTNGSVFKSGMVAIVSVYGVAWMAETYFGAYLPEFKETLGQIVLEYPWTYAIVLFLISKLVNSQAAALAIVVPMALSVGFDRSGTTRIGRFVINHSFIIPGFIGITVGCCVGYVITHLLY